MSALQGEPLGVNPAGFDAPRQSAACSGYAFRLVARAPRHERRVEGLTLSKLRSSAPKPWPQKFLRPRRLLHERFLAHTTIRHLFLFLRRYS